MYYQIWHRWANTLEEMADEVWEERACFSFLQDEHKERYVQVRIHSLPYGKENVEKWFSLFLGDVEISSKIVEYNIEDDFYTVILDMHSLSYEWAFSILTLLRYPGEHYNVCQTTHKIMEDGFDKWKALFIAHQTFEKGIERHYNVGHALFFAYNPLSSFDIKRTFEELDGFPPYNITNKFNNIQAIWTKNSRYGEKKLYKKEDYE